MTAAERAILAELTRRSKRYLQAGDTREAELTAMRELWEQARALEMRSEVVAEASGVSPASVRMWWAKERAS